MSVRGFKSHRLRSGYSHYRINYPSLSEYGDAESPTTLDNSSESLWSESREAAGERV